MAAYDKEKVRKIARMLESSHDGEAAAAARKLAGMAKGAGQNLDEMLVAVYGRESGGGGGASSGDRAVARELKRRLDDALHMVEIAKEACAAALAEAEHEKAKRIALERGGRAQDQPQQPRRRAFDPDPIWGGDPFSKGSGGFGGFSGFQSVKGDPYRDPALETLFKAYEKVGKAPLTQWEINFVDDILGRGHDYTSRGGQIDIIDRIIEKLNRWAGRNGSAQGFWGAP